MKARRPGRVAAFVASAAMTAAASAQAAVPAYPPYPTGSSLVEVAAWLRANTSVPLGAVVGVGSDSVFSLEPTEDEAVPPILRVSIRQEVINAAFAATLGGRSAVMVADIDCAGHRVFQRSLALYAGNNRQGAVRRMGAASDWQAVPPGTFMDDVVVSVCDPNYHPLFPGGQVAGAAPPPGPLANLGQPRPPAASRPVRSLGPPIPLIAPLTRPAAPAAAPPRPAEAPAPAAPSAAPAPPPAPPRGAAPVAVAVAAASPDGPIATQPAVRPVLIAPPNAQVAAQTLTPPAVRTAAPPAPVVAAPIPVAAPPPVQAPPPPAPPPRPAAPSPPPPMARPPVTRPPVVVAQAPRPAVAAPPPAARPAPSAAALGLRPLVLGRAEIGAYPTVDAAIAAWRAIAGAYPTAMAGKRQRVELSTAGGVTRFRAFVDGFSSRGEAESFCRPISAEGRPCRAVD